MGYDAIVVGGGPGGSTAAWRLAREGARTLVLDAAEFPRVKLCAGWVTPRVMADLELDPSEYPHTIEPFSRATLELADRSVETTWDRTASYGIVRKEFDHFLLERARAAGAEVMDRARVSRVERDGRSVEIGSARGSFRARLVVGAGGHHCPVSRAFGGISEEETVVVTQESETRIGRERLAEFAPRPGVPELFPEPDFRGYGWYFSKGDFLNVGIGCVGDGRDLRARTEAFVGRLRESGRLPGGVDLVPFRGHAYALRLTGPRQVAGPEFLLAGDAAALARNVSGEGIGPAVASGRMAAEAALRMLEGEDARAVAASYRSAVSERFGTGDPAKWGWLGRGLAAVPRGFLVRLARLVCRSAPLRRRLVFEGAFGMG